MSIPKALSSLAGTDELRELFGLDKPAFIHKDHRWVLPVLAYAQIHGLVQTPALLAVFDYHTDFAQPFLSSTKGGEAVTRDFRANPTVELAIRICDEYLDKLDGDWVSSGMELGIISDAIVFGSRAGHWADRHHGEVYKDMLQEDHFFWSLPLPRAALSHQGVLADHHNKPTGLWEMLGWSPTTGLGIKRGHLILDFDLDVFVCHNELGPNFPWPESTFAHQFPQEDAGQLASTIAVSSFMNQLVEHSSIITVAREPQYCGSDYNCDAIFKMVNQYVFRRTLETA